MTSLPLLSLKQWLAELAGPRAVPAGGALALVTLAGAAALAAKVLRRTDRDTSTFEGLAPAFLSAAEEDAGAYARAVRNGGEALAECLELGLCHAGKAAGLVHSLAGAFEGVPAPLAADLAASERLARAAARTLLLNLAVNLVEWEGNLASATIEELRQGMDAARQSLGAQ